MEKVCNVRGILEQKCYLQSFLTQQNIPYTINHGATADVYNIVMSGLPDDILNNVTREIHYVCAQCKILNQKRIENEKSRQKIK